VTTPETQAGAAPSGAPLAIIAAGGNVPFEVAAAAMATGRRVLVIALEGEAEERLQAFPHAVVKWGQIGRIEQLLAGHGAREVVFIGSVERRPDFSSIGVDLGTLRFLPRIIKAMAGGDDTVLGNIVQGFEEHGYRVVGAHEVAPQLVAAPGLVAGPEPGRADREDVMFALAAARAIGALDAGQAAVAVGGRVIALEAAEGTDAMLERVEAVREKGRVRWKGRAGVLAKRSKPQQDLRVDMPAIGPRTVERVARAGLAGIAIEPGRVLIAERAETLRLAARTGTFIYAVADAQLPGGA
jgi:DUF1009 family protein